MEWLKFWDAEGLRTVAELIQAEIAKPGRNRRVLGRESNVSYQTISNLLKNLNNSPGVVEWSPDPEVILNVAKTLPNPDTSAPFDPEELLRIARGQSRIQNTLAATERYLVQNLPYPAAVLELWRLIGDRTVERAARDWDIPVARLNELLRSEDPALAMPRITEVYRIVSKSYPDKVANRLINLYIDPSRLPHAN